MFSMFFVKRPVFSFVTAIFICIIGLASLISLPVAQYPNITLPTINVTCSYPGADAETVEETVAAPIEQQVNGAIGMLYMSSKSAANGSYSLAVTFELERDLDLAQVDVQNRINQIQSTLPAAVTAQGLQVTQSSPDRLMVWTLNSPTGVYDETFLSNYTTINILDSLKRTKGVGDAQVMNQKDYCMRIWVKPDKLAKLGLSEADISNAIATQNVQAPVGQIGTPPFKTEVAYQYTIVTKGRLSTVEDFGNIILKTNKDGSYVRLQDVANIELGALYYSSFGKLNGQPGTIISISQRPNANALDTAKNVRATIAELQKSFPEGIEAICCYDSTAFVNASIEEVLKTLYEAFILVLLVVFIFLQNWRMTIIPMVAVPISLLGTFGFFIIMGFSINTLTLFALVLAIGIVVDDAIVVVEAVAEKIERGMDVRTATEVAMGEVGGPVVAIALILCAVFIPVAFLGGITGELYKQFALTLAASVALSAFVAMTLTPTMCVLFLKPASKHRGPLAWAFGLFNWCFDKATNGYCRVVKGLSRYSFLGIIIVILICFAAIKLEHSLPKQFVPEEDQGYILASMSLADATSLSETSKTSDKVEQILSGIPGVKYVITIGGYDLFASVTASNYSSYMIVLESWEHRKTENLKQPAILKECYKRTACIPNATIMFTGIPALPGLGTQGGIQFELENRKGASASELADVATKFLKEVRKDPKIMMAYTQYRANVPRIFLNIDRDKTQSLGVNVGNVFRNLNTYLGGSYVNDINLFGRTYRVYVQARPEYRDKPDDIGHIYVPNNSNDMVPLGTLLTQKNESGPVAVNRYNLYPTAEITAQGYPGVSDGHIMNVLETAAKSLPQGYGYEYTGQAYQQKMSSSSQSFVLVLAVIFVFLLLAALYESWSIPMAVLLALPFGVMGAFLGQALRGQANDTYCQIGLVMLLGLAAKNAILIVEFAKVRRDEGYSIIKAAVEAARLRLRPILMTSFAFIFGVMPLMLSSGAGAGARQSMGTAVFFGMLCATCIGIFLIPQLYAFVQKATDFCHGIPKDDPAKEDDILKTVAEKEKASND